MAVSHLDLPTTTVTLSGEVQSTVNARELHERLNVGRDFSNWIRQRIENYGFIEGDDYRSPNPASAENKGLQRFFPGHNRKDYFLSLDMAKELAMLENNDQGRIIRRALIQLERQMREDVPALISKLKAENQQLKQRVVEQDPQTSQLIRYSDMGLTPTEIGKLLGVTDTTVRQRQIKLESMGLMVRNVDPARSKAGKKGALALQRNRGLLQ